MLCQCGASQTTLLTDGSWQLQVQRVLRDPAAVQLPSQVLTEADYVPSTEGTTHAVVISMQGQRVSIGDAPWSGARSAGDDQPITFELADGTPAGGRFSIWEAAEGLQAELTIYGSGRPIVLSERGALVPDM